MLEQDERANKIRNNKDNNMNRLFVCFFIINNFIIYSYAYILVKVS